jgi:nucleoside-diphosphate-sugar epimerase
MKILITGGNGYIAQSLYKEFESKYDITLINRKNLDLTNKLEVDEWFEDQYFDVVIHCAVVGGSRLKEDNDRTIEQNLIMCGNLISNKSHFNKFIHFGSGAEIYSQDSLYGKSKHILRQFILSQNNCYNLRIFAVFDENELDTRFIKGNIKRYLTYQPITIHQDKFMDFFYMKDLASLIEYYILNSNLPQEVNCSYNKKYTLSDIANIINNLDNHSVDVEYNTKGLTSNYSFNGENPLPNLLFLGLEEGIKNVYNKLKYEY